MYCYECETDPCKLIPDEARVSVEAYERWYREQVELETSKSELSRIFQHALFLGLDTTEVEYEPKPEE